MEHLQEGGEFQKPSDVSGLMPCELDWKSKGFFIFDSQWIFWSKRPNHELNYQRMIFPMMAGASVVPSYKGIVKEKIKCILEKVSSKNVCLVQFWAPIKVNGWTFLSTADQPFALCIKLDKSLCSYRRLRLDTLIPIDINNAEVEGLLGPPGRVFRRGLPEFCPDVRSYSNAEFPLLEDAIRLGIRRYWAWPVIKPHDQHCLGVLELAFIDPTSYSPYLPRFLKEMELRSSEINGLFYPKDIDSQPSELCDKVLALDQIEEGLHVIRRIHSLPFAQIWIPRAQSSSTNVLIATGKRSYDSWDSICDEFADASDFCYIQTGKAVVGRAFSSQGSCFCKDVTLLSLTEYPLIPSARKGRLTKCFALCLRSNCINFVIEYFLPPNEMVDRDAETFLNMLLSTMKEQLPGVVVASGEELGQRMLVEVVKVSSCDELDSFEIGQPRLSVQSLQVRGETADSDSLCQQSNLQNGENNVITALLVPSCSSHRHDLFNIERPGQVDLSLQHPAEAAVTNRQTVNMDVALDGHIEFEKERGEMMQTDLHFGQPNVETDSADNARSNDKVEHNDSTSCSPVLKPRHRGRTVKLNSSCGRQLVEAESINEECNFLSGAMTNFQRIESLKNKTVPRLEKDYGITREILEQHFGKSLIDAAKTLSVSRSTLKRICREYDISRWPHHKTRKVYHHVNHGLSLQGAEPLAGDQQCPVLSQEKGLDSTLHKRSPATGKPCDSLMTVKVTYRGDMIKFQLSLPSTKIELEEEVEKRLNISLQRFSIKYQDEDDDWILITSDSDLRNGMHSLRLLGRTTMKLVVTPKSGT